MQEKYSAQEILNLIKTKKSDFWERMREQQALNLFHRAARRVPAYKDFLKKHSVSPAKIKTWKDFQHVPIVDKKNYLRQYSLEKLCWDGSIQKPLVFTATSGSTGEPFYFARQHYLDWQYSILLDFYLKNGYLTKKGPTLVIITLGMGIWIGGLITYQAFEIMARRNNYSVSIITPGVNKIEIFHALKKLAPHFNQTILVGYPPFVKDIVDEAIQNSINLKKLNLRLLFAAEAFTETFREYLVKKAGIRNLYLDTLNIYGSADMGAMAFETPTAILIRRLATKNKELFKDIFTNINKSPTLAQYNPLFITFESLGGEIALTSNSAIPLVRYKIGDHGGVFGFNDLTKKMDQHGANFNSEIDQLNLRSCIYQLPFVYVYERADFSVNFYGAIIYPEHIKHGIENHHLEKFLTGKFTIKIKNDAKQNQCLEINLELKPKIKKSVFLEKAACTAIINSLLKYNSEYANNYNMMLERVIPELIFWSNGHPKYFKSGIKQKWIKK